MRGADPSKTQAGGGLQRRRLGRGRAPGEGRELRAARPLPRELEDVTLGVTPAAPTCDLRQGVQSHTLGLSFLPVHSERVAG